MQPLDRTAKTKAAEAAKVKSLVFEAGLTFAQIDREFQLTSGTARDTLR